MILTMIPQWGRPESAVSVAGDVLTVAGTNYDLGPVPDGGDALWDGPAPFIGRIARIDGEIHATILVHVDDTAAQDQPDAPWVVDASGPVAIPAVRLAGAA